MRVHSVHACVYIYDLCACTLCTHIYDLCADVAVTVCNGWSHSSSGSRVVAVTSVTDAFKCVRACACACLLVRVCFSRANDCNGL